MYIYIQIPMIVVTDSKYMNMFVYNNTYVHILCIDTGSNDSCHR